MVECGSVVFVLFKKILNSVVRQQTLDVESLTTFMCEVENIINNRPLTAVSNDVKDLQPLTPNMHLCLKEKQSLPTEPKNLLTFISANVGDVCCI